MNVLFVHDHRFVETPHGVFSNQFSYSVLKRYLAVFDSITVVGRRASTSGSNSKNLALASGEGVRFVFLENISSLQSFFGSRQIARKTLYHLVEESDSLIVRLPSELGLLAANAAVSLRRNYAVELVGCSWDALWFYGTPLARLYAPLQFLRTRCAVRRANYVSYVTQSYLQNRYPPRSSAFHTSISNASIPGVNEVVLEARLASSSLRLGRTSIGVIGSLHTKYKGIQTGIKAIAALKELGKDVELRILGAGDFGPYERLARKLGIADRVVFNGTLPSGNPVFEWLDKIDIYIQPSLTEGLPRALIEAMSRGCPAVATRVGGIPELLPDYCLFLPGDDKHLARLLDSMINSESLRRQSSRDNFFTAKKYLSKTLDARRHEFLFKVANLV